MEVRDVSQEVSYSSDHLEVRGLFGRVFLFREESPEGVTHLHLWVLVRLILGVQLTEQLVVRLCVSRVGDVGQDFREILDAQKAVHVGLKLYYQCLELLFLYCSHLLEADLLLLDPCLEEAHLLQVIVHRLPIPLLRDPNCYVLDVVNDILQYRLQLDVRFLQLHRHDLGQLAVPPVLLIKESSMLNPQGVNKLHHHVVEFLNHLALFPVVDGKILKDGKIVVEAPLQLLTFLHE